MDRRARASTTVEAPASWGGDFFKKASVSAPNSPASSPSSAPSSPPPISLGSRTSSMATMRQTPASDPQHRRVPSLSASMDSPTMAKITASASPYLSLSPSRATMPPGAFTKANMQAQLSPPKPKGFRQTIVDFIKSPRGGSKPVSTYAPNPYLNSSNTNIDTAIFGVELEVAVRRSNRIHELLPDVVYKCIVYLRDKAPQEEGIFRVTGSVADIKKIRDVFDQGHDYDISSCLNPHTVAGLLKLFIRESPQRLIPATWSWSEARPVQELHNLIKQLTPANRCFLSCLIKLLCIISQASVITKMGVSNLVIVFSAALQCTGTFLTHVINYAQELFPVDEISHTKEWVEAEKKATAEKERQEKEPAEQQQEEKQWEAKEAEEDKAESAITKQDGKTEEAIYNGQHEETTRQIEEEKATQEEARGDGNTLRAKKEKKKHEHKKKEKRRPEDHTKTRKRDQKEKGKARGKEDDKLEKAPVSLFGDEKDGEDDIWKAHMEQYEKGEEKRKNNKESRNETTNEPTSKEKEIEVKEKEREKEKEEQKEDKPKALTVEVGNERRQEDGEDDIFKEDQEKEWEMDVNNQKVDKKKVKRRMQTIFDSDDDE